MIYVMTASEADIQELKTHKLLWNILLSNKKSGVSSVFPDISFM